MKDQRLGAIILLLLLSATAAVAAEPPESAPLAPPETSVGASYEAIFEPAGCEDEAAAALPLQGFPPAQAADGSFCCVSCDTGTICGNPIACCINRNPPGRKCCLT